MKIFYKIISLIGIALILLMPLSGCLESKKANSVKEIEFWTLQLSDFSGYIDKIIAGYEKLHPGIKIKWIDVPFSEGEKRSLAAVMSNKVPDLINMNPSFGSTLASKGALVNIRQYITQDEYNKYLKESWDASSLNNKVFGIPWYITSSITIYNAEIMKKAGLNPANPPKNYEELKEYSKIIKQRTGKYAFMPNLAENGKIIEIFNGYNIPIVNKDQTEALFNSDKAIKILDFWVDIYNKGYIPPESLTESQRTSLERYQAGDSAFIFAGSNFLKIIKENAPQVYKETRVAPQVTGSTNRVNFALMNLVVPEHSKYKKEAVDFGLYLTNHQNQLEFCKLAPILPSAVETLNSDFFKEKPNSNLLDKGRTISAKQLKRALKPPPILEDQKDLFEIADQAVQQALLKQKTSKQALDDAVRAWNEILKK